MAGETRIIAFGANGTENGSTEPLPGGSTPLDDSQRVPWVEWEEEAATTPARSWTDAAVPLAAVVLIVAWTGFYVWSQAQTFPEASAAQVPGFVTQWAVPVLLVVALWLLFMRSSRREAARFGDAAALLSRESANLEARLHTVNGELSLAREFVAAQARDLESVGRLATERLSQNAERLQELVRENGDRLDTIHTVSKSALENMDRLRGQLPVIASSAKDVTNQIGNAGRAAHGQLEDLIGGIGRLNEAGAACSQQVAAVRESMDAAASGFTRACEDLERLALARFEALQEKGGARGDSHPSRRARLRDRRRARLARHA
jgi:hypothetical protein